MESLLNHINEPLLDFLANNCDELLSPRSLPGIQNHSKAISGVTEVSAILQMLTAVLDRFLSRESAERTLVKESLISVAGSIHSDRASSTGVHLETKFISNAFAYSFVWAVAGRIHET